LEYDVPVSKSRENMHGEDDFLPGDLDKKTSSKLGKSGEYDRLGGDCKRIFSRIFKTAVSIRLIYLSALRYGYNPIY
jgi:hypothetical protein